MNRVFFGLALAGLITGDVYGSTATTGENEIDSSALTLPDGTPLTGTGAPIGQVEDTRPGLPGFDSAQWSDPRIIPAGIFRIDGAAVANNMNVMDDSHSEWVAGIMIARETDAVGVAKGASLFSSAYETLSGYENALLSLQKVATQTVNGISVRAINNSWNKPRGTDEKLNGQTQLTLGFDWIASRYALC